MAAVEAVVGGGWGGGGWREVGRRGSVGMWRLVLVV